MGEALAYKYDYYDDTCQEKVAQRVETKVFTPRPFKIRFGDKAFAFQTALSVRIPEVKEIDGGQISFRISRLSMKNIIKINIRRTILQPFHEWGEIKPSEKTVYHAYKLVDLCDDDVVLGRTEVTTGGNGTIMLTWSRQDVLATLDVGETTFTYSVISKDNYERLGGGRFSDESDAEVKGLYRLLR